MTSAALLSRFWSKVNKTDSCWIWTAGKNKKGYGQFHLDGKKVKAHRLSYQLIVGKIPNGLVIDHLCRNTSCVNPDHLEPVTHRENTIRGNTYGSGHNRTKTHCPHGHEYNLKNTRISSNGYRKCRVCHNISEKERRQNRKSLI